MNPEHTPSVAQIDSNQGLDSSQGPFHVLMLGPDQHNEHRDPTLETDYLSRRYRCLQKARKDGAPKDEDASFWSGASSLERALVSCCDADGAIAPGKQVVFLGLISRHCNTTASQALALAILQRTTRTERKDADEDDMASDEEGGESEYEEEHGVVIGETEPDAQKKTGNKADTEPSPEDDKEEDLDRISTFLAAGGLLTLSHWLENATTPVTAVAPKPSTPPQGKKQGSSSPPPPADVTISNPPTGPILLPLLSLLEAIPLHKNLITETKINKSIRNLKKKLDEVVEKFERRAKKETVKLDEFRHPVAGGNVVVQVQKAVEFLMESWKEKAKEINGPPEPEDPYKSLKDILRKRFEVLLQYEADENAKPEWLERMEEPERLSKKLRTKAADKKMSTHQLEALEHRKERDRIKHALQKTQQEKQEAKEKLEQLRKKMHEQQLKRKADKQIHAEKKRRRIQWKDGLDSDIQKRRNLLEVVHEYPPEQPEESAAASNKENVDNEATNYLDATEDMQCSDDELEGDPAEMSLL